jgi:hypothetical protein
MTKNKQPFSAQNFYRLPLVVCRMPLLSLGAPNNVSFACREKGRRVQVKLQRRWPKVELARTDDAAVMNYAISMFMHAINENNWSAVSELPLDINFLLSDLRLAPSATKQIVDSLRRLTGTLVSVLGWDGPPLPTKFPLFEIRQLNAMAFHLKLSTWLENELVAYRVVTSRPAAGQIVGVRQRLYGWAVGWVGPEHDGGRMIRQREALERIGPVLDRFGSAWDQIVGAVEANDLPGYDMQIATFEGRPAIFMRKLDGRCNRSGATSNADITDQHREEFEIDWGDEDDAAPRQPVLLATSLDLDAGDNDDRRPGQNLRDTAIITAAAPLETYRMRSAPATSKREFSLD